MARYFPWLAPDGGVPPVSGGRRSFFRFFGVESNEPSSDTVSPTTGTVSFVGNVPVVSDSPYEFQPSTGTVTFTGNVATIQLANPIMPAATGVITFSGNRPLVDYSSLAQEVWHETPVAWIADYGHAARFAWHQLGIETAKRDSVATYDYQPTTGDVTFTGYPPTIIQTTVINANTGELEFIGGLPTIGYSPTLQPATGTITFTGNVPLLDTEVLATPTTGTVSFTGNQPIIVLGVDISPTTGEVTFTGDQPTVDKQEIAIDTIGTGVITLSGNRPLVLGVYVRRDDGAGKGKKGRRKKDERLVVVNIDGEDFIVESEAEARELLAKTKEQAEALATQQVAEIVSKRKEKSRKSGLLNTSELRLEIPQVKVSSDDADAQQSIANMFSDAITSVYKQAAMAGEIQVLLLKQQLDEEDNMVSLLLTL